jgi:hypothetical protein
MLQTLLGVAGAVGGLSMIPMMFGAGQPSQEEQEQMLRRQLEIQDEFEQQKMARMGGGAGLEGLVGGGRSPSVAELIADEQLTRQLAGIAKNLGSAREAPMISPELEELLAGQTARLATLQQSRTMTPMEILSRLEAARG